jgi:hypothetical protein
MYPVLVTPHGYASFAPGGSTWTLDLDPLPTFADPTSPNDRISRPLRSEATLVPEPIGGKAGAQLHAQIASQVMERTGRTVTDPTGLFTDEADALERLLDSGPSDAIPTPDHITVAAALASDKTFRDYALARIATPPGTASEQLRTAFADGDDAAKGQLTGEVLQGNRPPSSLPPGQLDTGLSHLELISQISREGQRADAMSVTAILNWWQSKPGAARAWATAAQHDQPDHTMARLAAAIITNQVEPGWTPRKSEPPTEAAPSEVLSPAGPSL